MKIFLLACVLCAHALAKREMLSLEQVNQGASSVAALENTVEQEESETKSALSSVEEDYTAERTKLTSAIGHLSENIAQIESDLQRASGTCAKSEEDGNAARRKAAAAKKAAADAQANVDAETSKKQSENAKFNARIAEHVKTINTMAKMISHLESTGFLQTEANLSSLHAADRAKIESLIQDNGEHKTTDATASIIKMIEDIKSSAEEEKFNAARDKILVSNAQDLAIQSFSNTRNQQNDVAKRALAAAGDHDATNGASCQEAADLSDERDAQKKQQAGYEADLKKATAEFKETSTEAHHYIQQLDDAEAVLNHEHGNKVGHDTVAAKHAADTGAFIQLASTASDIRERIASLLQNRATKINSKRLQSASILVALSTGGPLTGIVTVIKDKINELEKEQDAEAKQHAACKALKKEVDSEGSHLQSEFDKYSADEDRHSAKADEATNAMQAAQENLAEQADLEASATKEQEKLNKRMDERLGYAQGHLEDLAKAKKQLFGTDDEGNHNFKTDPNVKVDGEGDLTEHEATKESVEEHKSAGSGVLVDLVQNLEDSIAGDMKAMQKVKDEKAAEVEALKKDGEVNSAAQNTIVHQKHKAIAYRKKKASAAFDAKNAAMMQMASAGKRKAAYVDQCVNTAESHEDRMAKLRDEQTALKDARELLRDAEKDVNA